MKSLYPRACDVKRLIALARASGVNVRSISFYPDGRIDLGEEPRIDPAGAADAACEKLSQKIDEQPLRRA